MINSFQSSRVTTALRKVPEITISFWLIKLLTTAMGEVFSDFLVRHLPAMLAVALGGIGFVVAIGLQFSVRRYIPWVYWLLVVMVAIFGTMAADIVHSALGVPYLISTLGFILALALVFSVWYRSEKTLSIHSITTPRRELFYWAAVIATFALGTAAGDLTARTVQLGYFTSGVMFTAVIALIWLAYWRFGLNEVPAFWSAYILTRPLGASFADWMGHDQSAGGLGFGTGQVSLALTIAIVIAVGYLSFIDAKRQGVLRPTPEGERV